jgi:hypothetical protein
MNVAGGRNRTGTGLAALRIFIPLRFSPPPRGRLWSGLSLHQGCCLSGLYTLPLTGAWLGSREPRRKRVVAMRHRSFARADHAHRGKIEKPDLYAAATCIKVRSYFALPRYRTAAKDFRSFGKVSLCFRVGTRRRNLSIADTTTSFSLKSSLPPSWWLPARSSLPSSLSWPCRPL